MHFPFFAAEAKDEPEMPLPQMPAASKLPRPADQSFVIAGNAVH
jgi:hypothetical protein